MPWWVPSPLREQAYFTDPEYLRRIDIELRGPIPVDQVIPTMGTAIFNPVLIRPLFDHLGLVTCRTFETPCRQHDPAVRSGCRVCEGHLRGARRGSGAARW